ncbi:type II toxin-antitoxin system RelE/ParE family toxin [Halpernia sp.]|uniref:type II toxin-antitoxin system RelE/ParE family toxin n=1 Tax=Halpernia sp. TaxID=2782209 RepID=UPI003A95752D
MIKGIFNSVEILEHFPLKGEKEELLINNKKDFRYLIYKNYKIIYWQNEKKNRIEIVNVFDTRQNPMKIKKLK